MTKTRYGAALLVILAALTLAARADATFTWLPPHHKLHLSHKQPHKAAAPVAAAATTSVCPFDGADRTFTIVNVGVTGVTLQQIAAIQTAVRDESFALRAYYATPCARFGSGGTPIYLSDGCSATSTGGTTCQMGGVHNPSEIRVQTGQTPYTTWVRAFSHEVVEDLVDPNSDRFVTLPGGGRWLEEIADPVENRTYEVDQLQVSDWVTPHWFGGMDPNVGPWDAAHILTGPYPS